MRKSIKEPSFSVVIPTFGRAKLVSQAIASVLAQSYQAREIIVVDDGSDPPIGERIQPLAENVQLIRLPANRGVGAARNVGMMAAQAEYIAFLDSDDTWEPRRLELAKEKISVVSPTEKQIFIDNSVVRGRLISRPPAMIDDPRALADALVFSKFLIPTPSLIFHSKWRGSLQFDPLLRCHEDWDLLISAVAQGFKLVNLDTSAVGVRGGIRRRLSTQRDIRSATRFIESNSVYMSQDTIAFFEDLNLRSPQRDRLRYVSMILARLYRRQVSKGGALGRLLMAMSLRQVAD
jgi:glycosyltransferase involved in cell wall biosynthesis